MLISVVVSALITVGSLASFLELRRCLQLASPMLRALIPQKNVQKLSEESSLPRLCIC